jgi:hypothetical protein
VLRKLTGDAQKFLNDKVEKAVITVPAYFNDSQRQVRPGHAGSSSSGLRLCSWMHRVLCSQPAQHTGCHACTHAALGAWLRHDHHGTQCMTPLAQP